MRLVNIVFLVIIMGLLNGLLWSFIGDMMDLPMSVRYPILIITGGLLGWNGDVIWDRIFGKEAE